MDLDGFEIRNPKCFLVTISIGIVVEIIILFSLSLFLLNPFFYFFKRFLTKPHKHRPHGPPIEATSNWANSLPVANCQGISFFSCCSLFRFVCLIFSSLFTDPPNIQVPQASNRGPQELSKFADIGAAGAAWEPQLGEDNRFTDLSQYYFTASHILQFICNNNYFFCVNFESVSRVSFWNFFWG